MADDTKQRSPPHKPSRLSTWKLVIKIFYKVIGADASPVTPSTVTRQGHPVEEAQSGKSCIGMHFGASCPLNPCFTPGQAVFKVGGERGSSSSAMIAVVHSVPLFILKLGGRGDGEGDGERDCTQRAAIPLPHISVPFSCC